MYAGSFRTDLSKALFSVGVETSFEFERGASYGSIDSCTDLCHVSTLRGAVPYLFMTWWVRSRQQNRNVVSVHGLHRSAPSGLVCPMGQSAHGHLGREFPALHTSQLPVVNFQTFCRRMPFGALWLLSAQGVEVQALGH